jgi:hypothetical protein
MFTNRPFYAWLPRSHYSLTRMVDKPQNWSECCIGKNLPNTTGTVPICSHSLYRLSHRGSSVRIVPKSTKVLLASTTECVSLFLK